MTGEAARKEGDTFYYWVRTSDNGSSGRSNSRDVAITMARDIAKAFGEGMKVVVNHGRDDARTIVEFAPGGEVVAGSADAE